MTRSLTTNKREKMLQAIAFFLLIDPIYYLFIGLMILFVMFSFWERYFKFGIFLFLAVVAMLYWIDQVKTEYNQGIDVVVDYLSQEYHNCKESDSFFQCESDLDLLKHLKENEKLDDNYPLLNEAKFENDYYNQAIDDVELYLSEFENDCVQKRMTPLCVETMDYTPTREIVENSYDDTTEEILVCWDVLPDTCVEYSMSPIPVSNDLGSTSSNCLRTIRSMRK